jgi:hypothetical protein
MTQRPDSEMPPNAYGMVGRGLPQMPGCLGRLALCSSPSSSFSISDGCSRMTCPIQEKAERKAGHARLALHSPDESRQVGGLVPVACILGDRHQESLQGV